MTANLRNITRSNAIPLGYLLLCQPFAEKPSNVLYVGLSELTKRVLLTLAAMGEAIVEAMTYVLLRCNPFQVRNTVVSLNPILVIDLGEIERVNKVGKGNETMNSAGEPLALASETYNLITVPIRFAFKKAAVVVNLMSSIYSRHPTLRITPNFAYFANCVPSLETMYIGHSGSIPWLLGLIGFNYMK